MRTDKPPRAWYKKKKEMLGVWMLWWDTEGRPYAIESDQYGYYHADEFILLWPTGLLDKSGTEIYGGEWMKTGYRDDPGSLIGFVEYQIRSARWGIRVGHRLIEFGKRGRWYECLGKNVHQHPDLLKKESP